MYKSSIKKILLRAIIFICTIQVVNSQVMESKFMRPSMTILYLSDEDAERQRIIDAIVMGSESLSSGISSERFDKLAIGSKTVRLQGLPARPILPPTQGNFADTFAKLAYNKQIKKFNSNVEIKLSKKVSELSKDVLKSMFLVDKNGDMSDELLKKRGLYSATDADVKLNKITEISRLENIGYDLIERTYIKVYQLDDVVKLDKNYYDEIDRINKMRSDSLVKKGLLKEPIAPVQRLEEGYSITFNSYTYKISSDWSKSFFDEYWVDASTSTNEKNAKVSAFNQVSIPIELVSIDNGRFNATASYGMNAPLAQLFQNAAETFQDISFYEASSKVSDLAAKATISQAYPVLVKIGTKEDVYVEQRYFVYETRKKSMTDPGKSKFIGVVKAKGPIADNKKVADGSSIATTFLQTSGGRIRQGMYLVQKDFTNKNIQLDFYPSNLGDGFGFSYEFGWSHARVMGDSWTQQKGPNNLFAGMDLIILPSGYFSATIAMGKEIYLLKTGNLFLYPKLGLGYGIDDLGEGFVINPSIGLGVNVTPWFTLMPKYNYFNTVGFSSQSQFSIGGKVRF
jgi:hypothetical protein